MDMCKVAVRTLFEDIPTHILSKNKIKDRTHKNESTNPQIHTRMRYKSTSTQQ